MRSKTLFVLFAVAIIVVALLFFYRNGDMLPNVLIITIDTQRVDRLGCYGYPLDTSPNIDAFARDAIQFDRHYVQAPLTLPSHSTIFTGLYPFNHKVRSNGRYRLSEQAVTMAEVFKKNGYQTRAVISAGVLHSDFGLKQGFDLYSWNMDGNSSKAHTDAEYATKRAKTALEQRDGSKPVFLWVHYFDPHGPYTAPSRFQFEQPYDAEVAYADEQIGVLLDYLKEESLYDRTIIAITADHGQNLGEHDYHGHTYSLYEQTLHTPFLLRLPEDDRGGRKVTSLTRSTDIFPTLLSLAGVPCTVPVDGVDLSPLIQGRPSSDIALDTYGETLYPPLDFLHKKAVIFGPWKLITKYNLPPETDMQAYFKENGYQINADMPEIIKKNIRFEKTVRELYNLEEDEAEINNVYFSNPDVAEMMEKKLSTFQTDPGKEVPVVPFNPNKDLEMKIKALGY